MNAIQVIHPYKYNGMWVFDDDSVGLVREPFVSGADTILDTLTESIPNAESGFNAVFSAHEFPGYDVVFDWVRAEAGGNWYRSEALEMEGWLCPALLKYFDEAPARLFLQVRPSE